MTGWKFIARKRVNRCGFLLAGAYIVKMSTIFSSSVTFTFTKKVLMNIKMKLKKHLTLKSTRFFCEKLEQAQNECAHARIQ